MNVLSDKFSIALTQHLEEITERTNAIRPEHTMGDEVLADVYLFRDILRAVAYDGYKGISMVAWTQMLAALAYFLKVDDKIHDDQRIGLTDDLAEFSEVRKQFADEIDKYQRWGALANV